MRVDASRQIKPLRDNQSKSQVPADSNQGIGNKKCHAFSFETGYPTYLAQLKGGGTVWRFYRTRVFPSDHPGSGNMHYTLGNVVNN